MFKIKLGFCFIKVEIIAMHNISFTFFYLYSLLKLHFFLDHLLFTSFINSQTPYYPFYSRNNSVNRRPFDLSAEKSDFRFFSIAESAILFPKKYPRLRLRVLYVLGFFFSCTNIQLIRSDWSLQLFYFNMYMREAKRAPSIHYQSIFL